VTTTQHNTIIFVKQVLVCPVGAHHLAPYTPSITTPSLKLGVQLQ